MKYVFGPVASRRLGYSLGVELIPAKTCSFKCIYCQVGRTTHWTDKREEFVPVDKVLAELKEVLPQKDLHFITFSGSGEPTLHSMLGKVISGIREISETPVCVITNSSLIWRKDVRQELAKADVVIPSLDSASQETFEKINRPIAGITIKKIINGLIKFRKEFSGRLWLEIMLMQNINDSPEQIARLKEAVEQINPDRIDLNTVVRPPTEDHALALDQTQMERAAGMFGEKAQIINSFDKSALSGHSSDLEEQVYQLARRRGITINDLVTGLGIHKDVALDIINVLLKKGKIKKMSHAGRTYYRENY